MSNTALANVLSLNIYPNLENGIFVVTIVDLFIYLLAINWKNKFDP